MTAQALAGALAGLLIAAIALIVILERARSRAEDRRGDLALEAIAGRQRLELEREQLAAMRDRLHAMRARIAAVEEEVASSALVGELVVVNTPKPDDQTLRGVCTRELKSGGLVLEAAVYLEREWSKGAEVAREVPAGDVVVPAYSWAQVVQRTQTTRTEE
jgi:hypothetical protein